MPRYNIIRPDLTDKHIQRFWSKVDKSSGQGPKGDCWRWTSDQRPKPTKKIRHGKIMIAGHQVGAHVMSFRIANGKWPELDVLHSCDYARCVNPDHLREGNQTDNNQDSHERGLFHKGIQHWHAKTTEEDVREIRRLKGIIPQSQLAIQFHLSKSQISHIHTGESWKHIV